MDDNENRSYHRPLWDDNGRFYYELIPQAKEKNHVALCLVPPEKVIPVIFIPGVMGSNLKNEDGEVWQFSAPALKKWPLANAKKESGFWIRRPRRLTIVGLFLTTARTGKNSPLGGSGDGEAHFTRATVRRSTGCSTCSPMMIF